MLTNYYSFSIENVFILVPDPIVKEQGRMVSSNSPTPNALQGPISTTE